MGAPSVSGNSTLEKQIAASLFDISDPIMEPIEPPLPSPSPAAPKNSLLRPPPRPNIETTKFVDTVALSSSLDRDPFAPRANHGSELVNAFNDGPAKVVSPAKTGMFCGGDSDDDVKEMDDVYYGQIPKTILLYIYIYELAVHD